MTNESEKQENGTAVGGLIDPVVSCFSCDADFGPEDQNDRDEGWFCDECLENKNGR